METPTPPAPAPTTILPAGIGFYRKSGVTEISSIEDFCLNPDNKGFELLPDQSHPGGDVKVDLFDTHAEASAFYDGFDSATPGDDWTYCVETVKIGRRKVFAFLGHYSDTSDDGLQFSDHRRTPKPSKQA